MKKETIEVIELAWLGPLTVQEAISEDGAGIYSIWGTHLIYGRETLLYIGKTDSFKTRLVSHHETWMKYEYDSIHVHLGRVIGESGEQETESISIAEKMLIYYCAPAYNSNELVQLGMKGRHILLLNLGKKSLLPNELSTLWYYSDYWNDPENFESLSSEIKDKSADSK